MLFIIGALLAISGICLMVWAIQKPNVNTIRISGAPSVQNRPLDITTYPMLRFYIFPSKEEAESNYNQTGEPSGFMESGQVRLFSSYGLYIK